MLCYAYIKDKVVLTAWRRLRLNISVCDEVSYYRRVLRLWVQFPCALLKRIYRITPAEPAFQCLCLSVFAINLNIYGVLPIFLTEKFTVFGGLEHQRPR